MKKTWALVLAALLLSVSFTAAAGAEFLVYENATDGYRISYPADWTLASRENIAVILDKAEKGELPGIDTSAMAGYKEQIDAFDMMICAAPDRSVNFNIYYEDVGFAASDDLIIEELCPQRLGQMSNMLGEIYIYEDGDVLTAGDVTYVYIAFGAVANGDEILMSQMYYMNGTTMYTFTYTCFLDLIVDFDAIDALTAQIAASFVAPALG